MQQPGLDSQVEPRSRLVLSAFEAQRNDVKTHVKDLADTFTQTTPTKDENRLPKDSQTR